MTIWKELLNVDTPVSDLIAQAESRVDMKGLQTLCKSLGLAIYGPKLKLSERIMNHLAKTLHPRLREFRQLASNSQYEEVLSEIEVYLYNKSKSLEDKTPQPLIFTEIPPIETLVNDEDDEDDITIPITGSLKDTYRQFAILYLIEQYESSHRPTINGYKN